MTFQPEQPAAGPLQVVDLTNPAFQSLQGRYFLGQTGILSGDPGFDAWAALINPPTSNVNLFFDTFTLTNYSPDPFAASISLNSVPQGEVLISGDISPANTTPVPLPQPKAQIQFSRQVSSSALPIGGVRVFDRVVAGFLTEKAEYDGRIIYPPGGSLVIFIAPLVPTAGLFARVALGWWEVPLG